MTAKRAVKALFPGARVVDRDPVGLADKVVVVDGVALVPPDHAAAADQAAAWRAAHRAVILEAEARGITLPIVRRA